MKTAMPPLLSVLVAFSAMAGTSAVDEWRPKTYAGLEASGTVKVVPMGYKGLEDCLELRHQSGGFKFGAEKSVKPAVPGPSDWTVSVELACFGGGEAQVGMEFYSADGKLLSSSLGETARDSDWTKREWKFHADGNVSSAKIQLLSVAAGGVRYAKVKAMSAAAAAAAEIPLAVRCNPVLCTADWNGGKAVFNTFSDAPLPLSFHFKGERAKLVEPAFEIDLPAEFAISDAFTPHQEYYRAETPSVADVQRDGRAYRRHRFTRARCFDILKPSFGWARQIVIVVEPRDGKSFPARFPVYYRAADAGRQGAERMLEMSVTKMPKNIRHPKCFPVLSWEDFDRFCSKDDVFLRMIRAYEAAGCVSLRRPIPKFKRGHELVKILKKRGTGWFFPFGFNDLSEERVVRRGGYENLKVRRAVYGDGAEHEMLCPEYFNNDPDFRAYCEKFIVDGLRSAGVEDGDWITLDYEPWQSRNYCVCKTCLRKFAEFAGLPEPPSAADVADPGRLLDKWAQFRIRHCEEMIRSTSEIIHRYNPKLKVCDYDYIQLYGSGKEHLFYRNCAKDTRRNEKWFDMHLCSYYHVHDKAAFEAIRNNTRVLKKSYVPVGSSDGAGGYLGKDEVRHPRQLRQLALAAFVHGCPGLAFYAGVYYDGAQLYALMKARDEIAALEDLPWGKAEGALRAESSDGQFAFATTAKDGREVVALFNYSGKSAVTARVSSDAGKPTRRLVDPVDGSILAENADMRGGFEVTIPKSGVRFVEARP